MAWKVDQLYRMAIATGIKDIKAINVEDRIIPFVGSTESLDRDNDIIMLNGWDLKNFKQNPVFLWMHNHFIPPLGRSIKTVKNKETMTLDFDVKFPDEGLDPFRDNIFNLYAGGYLKATSVGFMPKEWKYGKDTDEDFNVKFVKQELWELSGVTIPSNPEALIRAKDAGAVDANFLEMLEKVNGEKIPYVPEPYYLIDAKDKDDDGPEEIPDNETEGKQFVELAIEEESIQPLFKGDTWLVELQTEQESSNQISRIKLLEPLSIEDKAGAVLNRKNKKKLTDAASMIIEVLESAEAEEDSVEAGEIKTEENQITDKTGLRIEHSAGIDSGKLEDWQIETIREFRTPKPEEGNSLVEMLGADVDIETMTLDDMKEAAKKLVKDNIQIMTLDPVTIQDAVTLAVSNERDKRLGKNLN